MQRKTSGITMLELLVSAAALVIILAAVPSIYEAIKIKTLDTRRLSNVDQLQSALQIYYLYNSNYPIVYPAERVNGTDRLSKILAKSFLVLRTRLPVDPESPKYDYTYQSTPDGKSFLITYCLEAYTDATHTPGCENKAYPRPIEWNQEEN